MSFMKHFFISLCLALLVGQLIAPAIFAKTIYVSTTGLDSNTGTISLPYLTITYAVSKSVAGDTIYVRGGTYTLTTTISISKNGTSSNKYYLLAYTNERPLLDFSGMTESSGNRGFNFSGSYWYVKGLDIKGAGDNGMNMSGSNNTLEYCSFSYNRDSGLQLGGGASNNRIINCDSYFNRDAGEGNADGFAVKLDVGTGNYYYGCRSWQNSDDGWDGYLRPSDDITTTLENCWCFMNGYRADNSASTGNGNGFKLGGSDLKTLRHNFILKNCLSFDNRVKGFDQNNNLGSMTLLNCTAYRNGTNYSFYLTLDTANGKVLTLKNCVALGSYGSITIPSVQQTNGWMSPFTTTIADFQSTDTTGIRGPRNSDGSLPTTTFMHLATGSDLIDAGTNVGIAYNGTAPDLGAFETGTAASLPTLTTTAVSAVTQTSASSGGSISSSGGASVSARGVCWNTSGTPTISDAHTSDGTGTGAYTSSLTGLSMGTVYYVRGYATNSAGTAYGSVISFSTTSAALPMLTTTAVSAITQTTASSGGSILSDGGASVSARGVCWNTSGTPIISDNHTTDGSGTGAFTSTMSGLSIGTLYYVRAYATNSSGTAYGSAVSFTTASAVIPTLTTTSATSLAQTTASSGGTISSDGGASITVRGVCWNTSGTPTISDTHTTDGTGTGTFTSSLTNLAVGTLYYVRAYATNSAGTAYGNSISFSTLSAVIPTVTTASISSITQTSASSGGTISSDGGAGVTARGICWNTTASPTTANSHTADGTGTGAFTSTLTSLVSGTTYHVRAYATNSVGTSYGGDSTFIAALTSQTDSVKWILTTNQTCTYGTHVAGTNQVLSSGGGILSMSVKDYTANGTNGGERCNLGSTSWPTESAQNDGRYIEFDVTPASGYDFTATGITFDIGYASTTSNMVSNLYYSTDNWATRTKLNSGNIVLQNSAWNNPAPSYAINVLISNGGNMSVRLYPWFLGSPSATKYVSLRNFVIKGTSAINTSYLSGNVSVKVIPQGYYNTGDFLNARDTIHSYLASTTSPYNFVDTANTILDSLTFTSPATFATAATGSYYLVVKQRNSVETWSATPITFTKGATVSFDFTNAQTKAYGDNLVLVSASPVRWAIYGGDVNQDGYVDPLDMSMIDADSFNYVAGSALSTDLNGDHYVDPLDMAIADQNSFNYVGVKKPTASKIVKQRIRFVPITH